MIFFLVFLAVWGMGALAFYGYKFLTMPVTALHLAVMNEDIALVKRLLDSGYDPNRCKKNGVTPLCIAAYDGYKNIAELLFEYGADIDYGLHQENGVNPLLNATLQEHTELREWLLEQGATVGIHFAAWQGDIDIVRASLENKSMLLSMRNRGMTPLHFAARGNQRAIAEFLIEQGADINVATIASETALHQAVRGNSESVIQLLADRGADLDPVGLGGTPLQTAIFLGHPTLAKCLIERGADVNSRKTSRCPWPIHTVARCGNAEIAELLIQNGADIHLSPNDFNGTSMGDKLRLLVSSQGDRNRVSEKRLCFQCH